MKSERGAASFNLQHPFMEILFAGITIRRKPLRVATGDLQAEPSALINRDNRRRIGKMKKPVLTIDEPEPKKILRADRPPTQGFVTVVDGHFKSEFDDVEAAEAAGRKLKAAYPMLQIEIYDAANRVRTLLSDEPGQPA